MSTTDTMTLVALTLLFAAFAASMAWAEAFVRRHAAARTVADASNQHKLHRRRAF